MGYRWVTCYACKGSGIIVYEEEDEDGEIIQCAEKCGRCDGTGSIQEYESDRY